MYVVNITRTELLPLLPRSETIAEIGVYRGGFASMLLRYAQPKRLHLIDPWGKDEGDLYVASYGIKEDMEALYQSVFNRHEKDISAGRVVMHRDYSSAIAPTFPDGYFDWVYIDGMHSFEAVEADLNMFCDKINKSGFILGHDFSNSKMGRVKKFGVVGAVTQFCRERGWKLLAITNEDAPTYVLTRRSNVAFEGKLIAGVVERCKAGFIEVDEALLTQFHQVEMRPSDGKRKLLIKFGGVRPGEEPLGIGS